MSNTQAKQAQRPKHMTLVLSTFDLSPRTKIVGDDDKGYETITLPPIPDDLVTCKVQHLTEAARICETHAISGTVFGRGGWVLGYAHGDGSYRRA